MDLEKMMSARFNIDWSDRTLLCLMSAMIYGAGAVCHTEEQAFQSAKIIHAMVLKEEKICPEE